MKFSSLIPPGRVLVAGTGFVGLPVARQLRQMGWQVVALTRKPETARLLASERFRVRACSVTDREGLAALGHFDAVIDCVSTRGGDAEAYRQTYLEGVRTLLEVCHPKRFLFSGSTSVYGQTDGSEVTEESPTDPSSGTGKILLEAEELVLDYPGGQVVRFGGIYAPGRWHLLERFFEGTAVIEGDGSRVINQIHRDDAVSALLFLLTQTEEAGIFNATDGQPLTQKEIYTRFAEHFGRSLPPTVPENRDRKRGWTSKRVSNGRLRSLGWTPKYQHFLDALLGDLVTAP